MALNLHISPHRPDWETIPTRDRNSWQKLAAGSKGWLTPANAISLLGATLVLAGLLQLRSEVTITGVVLILIGRLADIADGYIADKTGTKSPLGELVDTTSDKFIAAITIIALFVYGLLPLIFIITIALHTIVNSSVSLLGRYKKTIIHPSLEGKLATFSAWAVIIAYLMHTLLRSDVILFFAIILFIGFTYFATRSTYAYITQLIHAW